MAAWRRAIELSLGDEDAAARDQARAVVDCSHRPFDHGALDAPLDGLMMQSERPTYRKNDGSSR
jgi:hypothetical protein